MTQKIILENDKYKDLSKSLEVRESFSKRAVSYEAEDGERKEAS